MDELVAQFISYRRANIAISLHIYTDSKFSFCTIYDSQISYLCINIYILSSRFYIRYGIFIVHFKFILH